MSALLRDVRTAIEESLQESGISLSRILVGAQGEEIFVRGAVNTPEEKAKAEQAAAQLSRRANIRCDIEVALVYEAAEDVVYEAGVGSFPASDPPCWASRFGRTT
jgi:hypothetical protein